MGCSDVFKKDVVKRKMESTRFSANCKLEIDDFSRIIQDNISGTINCLAENIRLFMQLDETTKNGYLNRKALTVYLQNNEPDMSPKGFKIIDAVFDLNYLIYGESPDMVSKANLEGIVELATVLNREAALIYNLTFGSEAPGTYSSHQKQKERINNAVTIIRNSLLKIYRTDRGGEIHKINLLTLLETFIKKPETLDKVKKLIFLKRTFLGGEDEFLTHKELLPLFDNLPRIGQMALDIVRFKYLTLTSNEEMLLLSKDLDMLESIFFNSPLGNREDEEFFTLPQGFDAVLSFMKDSDLTYDKYKNLFIEFKQILMKGDPEIVSGKDFKVLLNHAKNIAKIGLDYNRFYYSDSLLPKMESKVALELKYEDYTHLFPSELENLKDFIRIANNYRFHKGEFPVAYYTYEHRRNSKAFFWVGLIEYGLKLFLDRHGKVSNGIGGKSLEAKDLKTLIKIYESELIDLGVFMPRKGESTAETISLLGSLFQYQSDDNKVLDANEGTEFIISFLTATSMSKEMMSYFKAQNCRVDQFDRIEPSCFKEKFFSGICSQYAQHLPLMMKYLGTDLSCKNVTLTEENAAFLDMSSKTARSCQVYPGTTEEIYYSKGDVFSIILLMLHIETTILRWDVNENNIMDEKEVMNAYSIYSPALDGMLEAMPSVVKSLKKYIYQWLVRYESVPKVKTLADIARIWDFVFTTPRTRPATRKTLAAILKVMSNESTKKAVANGIPQFQCEWLRDPDNIPRDP